MKRFFDMHAIIAGTAVAVAATAGSFTIAGLGFGNLYYVSVFMPFAMLGCLAVAWFMFLRDDGFVGRGRRSAGSAGATPPSDERHAGSRSDGFEAAEPRPAEPAMVPGIGSRGDAASGASELPAAFLAGMAGQDARGPDASLYAPLDGSIVARSGPPAEAAGSRDAVAIARIALVWAALELGAAAALLYSIAGIGSRFYR